MNFLGGGMRYGGTPYLGAGQQFSMPLPRAPQFGGGYGAQAPVMGGQQMYHPQMPMPNYGGPSMPLSGLRSYKKGTGYVPFTGPALLHQGEAVIPAPKAKKMRKVPLSSLLRLK